MISLNLLGVVSAAAYILSYAALAAYCCADEKHFDVFPFYAALTLAAAIHVTVVMIHTWHSVN